MLALMDQASIRDAAFCHRHREITREQGKALAAERLEHARCTGAEWVVLFEDVTPLGSHTLEMHVQSGRALHYASELPLDATESVRGSRTGEWVARCVVETGTSSMYTALAQAAEEPVLKQICQKIASDEFRHYKLFYDHMKRYEARERPGLLARARVILRRLWEARGDDELPFAYYCANPGEFAAYDRRASGRAYSRRASRYYRAHHIERAVAMALKALGIRPNGRIGLALAALARRWMAFEAGRLARA